MNLREAAERTCRSITTLRRYIRSGRLQADKRDGRFGPEYFVSVADLARAGLEAEDPVPGAGAPAPEPTSLAPAAPSVHRSRGGDDVPLALYQDLQMKHEQLLVQYGMVRAGGLRLLELQAELEARQRQLDESREARQRSEQGLQKELRKLKQLLRQARLELEGRSLEISALREKIRALEMLTRNAATSESIEQQFDRVFEQSRRVDRMKSEAERRKAAWRLLPDRPAPEH